MFSALKKVPTAQVPHTRSLVSVGVCVSGWPGRHTVCFLHARLLLAVEKPPTFSHEMQTAAELADGGDARYVPAAHVANGVLVCFKRRQVS